jgi:hypothetical protein
VASCSPSSAAITFVESWWELIQDDPDVWYWSERFVEAGGVVVPAGYK